MLLDQELGDGEAESGAFTRLLCGRGTAVEGFKYGLLLFAGYPNSGIKDGNLNPGVDASG